MELRSPISLELVNQGYIRGSKEFKAAYQRELRRRNLGLKEKERKKWKQYYQSKKATDPEWNAKRVKQWRESNPEKWHRIAQKASKNGVHSRFYERHRERVKAEKRKRGKEQRRSEPTFGLKKAIAKARRTGDFAELEQKLISAITSNDERCDQR